MTELIRLLAGVSIVDDEVELIAARVRAHECDALGEYLLARRPQLLAYIERQLGPALRRKVEPDDIYQEVSVEAVRALNQVDFKDHDPFSWLCQLAERRIVDAHRKFFVSQKRDAGREVQGSSSRDSQQVAIIEAMYATFTTASQVYSRAQRESMLAQAVAQLSELQQEILRLKYVEGLPSKEIAERIGRSDGAVRVMLTRSVSKLQEILDEESSEG